MNSIIIENQVLEVENLISYRGMVSNEELNHIIDDMHESINISGFKVVGGPITAMHGISDNKNDIELLLPVSGKAIGIAKYNFKEKIKIVNALVVKFIGNPLFLQKACDEMNQYILDKKLTPITVGYNMTRKVDPSNADNTEIDIYVGISPNTL